MAASLPIPENLAYLIHYGVATTTALGLLTAGVRSRRVAHEIGQQAQARGLSWSQVREWLRQLYIDGWRQEFGATSREVDDLAEFCRTRGKSPIRQLLENRVTTVDLAHQMNRLDVVAGRAGDPTAFAGAQQRRSPTEGQTPSMARRSRATYPRLLARCCLP